MKPIIITLAAAVALAFAAPSATAQPKKRKVQRVAGEYQVKFEEVGNSCGDRGIGFSTAKIKLKSKRGRRLSVSIPLVPTLSGIAYRDGKFRAKAKLGTTNTAGMLGRFAANGRVDNGVIQMVFIAEYFTTKKKPLCTQSWNVTGVLKKMLSRPAPLAARPAPLAGHEWFSLPLVDPR